MSDIDEFIDRLRVGQDPRCLAAADLIQTLWADREFLIKEIAYCRNRLEALEKVAAPQPERVG